MLHFIPSIFAAAGSETLINNSQAISQNISESWDFVWEAVLGSQLYRVMADIGTLVAICALLFFIITFAQKWLQNESGGVWILSELIFPMVIIYLLAGGGANLANLTYGLRNVMNGYNEKVLQAAQSQINFDKSLSAIADFSTDYYEISAARDQCNTIVDGEKMQSCIDKVKARADEIVKEYKENHTTATEWIDRLTAISRLAGFNPLVESSAAFAGSVAENGISKTLSSLAFSPFLGIAEAVLIAFQGAFQFGIEASLLLTAMVGPIAVGSSFLPNGNKPIYAWASGFMGLGMCKLALNMITGFVAVMLTQTAPIDTLPMAVFVGLIGPILALAISAGGGVALFNAIGQGSQMIAGAGGAVASSTFGKYLPRG